MADLLTPQLNAETPAPDWLQARRLAGRAALGKQRAADAQD